MPGSPVGTAMKLAALAPLAPLLMLTLALAGCTNGGGSDYVTPPTDDEGRYVIEMRNFQFTPEFAKVPVGATVVWMNKEGSHNVQPDAHSAWTKTEVSSNVGEHLELTFDEAGEFPYFCFPHHGMGMTGSVKVG